MVPDFFQDESEEALRAQVKWQLEHLGLDDGFFAKLLGVDRRRFSVWQKDADTLAPDTWRTRSTRALARKCSLSIEKRFGGLTPCTCLLVPAFPSALATSTAVLLR